MGTKHSILNYMDKICSNCKKLLDKSFFNKHSKMLSGLSSRCRNCINYFSKGWYAKNKERAKYMAKKYRLSHMGQQRKTQRNVRLRNRKLVLEHYGNKCACCGENKYEFLAIDHINGGGRKEQTLYGGSGGVYRSIIRNNFPNIYQILCHNCNMAKGFYGKCPHNF